MLDLGRETNAVKSQKDLVNTLKTKKGRGKLCLSSTVTITRSGYLLCDDDDAEDHGVDYPRLI